MTRLDLIHILQQTADRHAAALRLAPVPLHPCHLAALLELAEVFTPARLAEIAYLVDINTATEAERVAEFRRAVEAEYCAWRRRRIPQGGKRPVILVLHGSDEDLQAPTLRSQYPQLEHRAAIAAYVEGFADLDDMRHLAAQAVEVDTAQRTYNELIAAYLIGFHRGKLAGQVAAERNQLDAEAALRRQALAAFFTSAN